MPNPEQLVPADMLVPNVEVTPQAPQFDPRAAMQQRIGHMQGLTKSQPGLLQKLMPILGTVVVFGIMLFIGKKVFGMLTNSGKK